MGYNKMIAYGTYFELFEYEKRISENRGNSGKSASRIRVQDLESVRENIENRYKKRKDSVGRASMAFRRLVLSNLGKSENPLLLTFTYKENITDIKQGYFDFGAFIRATRYKFGQDFRYIAVPEFQKRGAVHFHALFWGLQSSAFGEECEWPKNRVTCESWKFGFVFLKQTDGDEKISSYLAKYLAKSFVDFRLKGQKSYISSRNIFRPIVVATGIDSIHYVLDDWVGVDNMPVQVKEYSTQWLGKGRWSLYKI